MGRRRKKEEKIIRKTLPEYYLCPNCAKNTVKVTLDKKNNVAGIRCSSCGLKGRVSIDALTAEVDAYSLFVDQYYGTGKVEEKKIA
jgi:transcription elongation factor Elf1